MQNRSSPFLQQDRNLLIFLVVVGYIATFITSARGTTEFSAFQIVTGILFGVIYLVLALFDEELLRRFSGNTRHIIYFSVQIALVFGIGWMLGPGGNWLMGLPLASVAVVRLSPRGRWPVYLGIVASFVLPILRYSTWDAALMNGLVISAGIFFSVLVSQMRLNEQRARENAERLTHDLEAANRQLAEYASQAEELATMQERNRLAREIHDNLGHYLTIVNVQLEGARLTLDSDPARAMDALTKAQDLAKKGLASVRESVSALRVSPVENRPLEDAVAELVDDTEADGLAAIFQFVGNARPVELKTALALYRVVQEGLTNVRKHADASRVDVALDFTQPDRIRLTVQDDGSGAVDTSGGFGLIGIRERVQLLGGEFKVETSPGKGFLLEVTVPVMEDGK
ncbi:MAG: sensor histidine kinase [Anaerolineales bacterium]|nr:sensor histidine kinase [Anaerolineales bacterium]NUQ85822.1 sensor histidine kinase [Anaerolineales bacterium]